MGDAAEKLPVAVDESEINLLLDDAGVNIWLDKYSDVFSDFDTRPLIKRKLSNDFITEICKMVREDPTAQVELNFNILDDAQDSEVEKIITNLLNTHFINNQKAERESIKKTSRKGYMLTALGFMLILILAYVASLAKGIFFLNSLPVLVEPLAWFVTWTGLDHIFKHYGVDKSQDINTRMLNAKINFLCLGCPSIEPDVTVEAAPAHKPRKVIPAGNNLRIA
jgi:hypothetical protein